MLKVKSLPFTSKKINSGKTCQLKKKNKCDKSVFSCCVIYPSTRTYIVPDQDGYRIVCFCTDLLEII